jgi:hypothetical protein
MWWLQLIVGYGGRNVMFAACLLEGLLFYLGAHRHYSDSDVRHPMGQTVSARLFTACEAGAKLPPPLPSPPSPPLPLPPLPLPPSPILRINLQHICSTNTSSPLLLPTLDVIQARLKPLLKFLILASASTGDGQTAARDCT